MQSPEMGCRLVFERTGSNHAFTGEIRPGFWGPGFRTGRQTVGMRLPLRRGIRRCLSRLSGRRLSTHSCPEAAGKASKSETQVVNQVIRNRYPKTLKM